MAIKKNCEQCNKEFITYPYDIKNRKFCSNICYWESKKGSTGYWLGKKRDQKTIDKIIKTKTGVPSPKKGKPNPKTSDEKHPFWKGNEVSYSGLHYWVYRKLGKPTKCEHCDKENLVGHSIHWANISGKYLRDRTDWLRLCAKCHKKYDKQ